MFKCSHCPQATPDEDKLSSGPGAAITSDNGDNLGQYEDRNAKQTEQNGSSGWCILFWVIMAKLVYCREGPRIGPWRKKYLPLNKPQIILKGIC